MRLGIIETHSTRVGNFSGSRSLALGKSTSIDSRRNKKRRNRSSLLSSRTVEACTEFRQSPRVLPALRTEFPFARRIEDSGVAHSTRQVDLVTVNSCTQQASLEELGVLKVLSKWQRPPWKNITKSKKQGWEKS